MIAVIVFTKDKMAKLVIEEVEQGGMRLLKLVNTAPNRGANTAGIPLVSGNYFGSVWRVGL
ncbi:hypothetical protein KKJ06_08115 [Xenorhabdus bovienii]|uniref:Uncharacterized protein n=1 Tax=Xenorhabdus bovienii str. Intermedium TaxID=1379677 RepID=A0A077QC84_XENBV|nr:hypothetical protein [Xenorhabdus bovienii]MDE9452837.1 hypothetical protein [Xenorhabdus bovienii]MDE9481094.1 hypothetical protein [Xenorhabdus bovienii]MDE9541878.1 hypothetical protein [Xenorhabdus bovienii]MDE9550306.1 hypothetical protein [Xenorhabdus bovienii]MDE9555402.1 hypothetical protein [Xenorhabdus bovienii]